MIPFVRTPEFGTNVLTRPDDPAPSDTPLAGLTATRFATGQGLVETEQPGMYNSGALALDHLSEKKFDDCSFVSYCGP